MGTPEQGQSLCKLKEVSFRKFNDYRKEVNNQVEYMKSFMEVQSIST